MKHIKNFESFINESAGAYGPKTKKFVKALDPDNDGLYMSFSDIIGDDPEDVIRKNTKALNVSDADLLVVTTMETEEAIEWPEILALAKKFGLKFAKFSYDDSDGYGVDAIAFTGKQ